MYVIAHLKVTIFSHNFSCNRLSPRGRELCMGFSKRFIAWGLQKKGGARALTADAVYASATRDRTIFRFHINTLDDFKLYLDENLCRGTLVEWLTAPTYEALDTEYLVRAGWVPKDYQKPVIDFLSSSAPVSKIAELQTGFGKAQPLTAQIRVPGGWKTMGEMRLGTEVIAYDGSVTTVEGVYPQGVLQMWRVTFEDGRSAQCCGEHLWAVYTPQSPHWGRRVMSAIELSLHTTSMYIDKVAPRDDEDGTVHERQCMVSGLLGRNDLTLREADRCVYLIRGLGGVAYAERIEDTPRYCVKNKRHGSLGLLGIRSVVACESAPAQCIAIAHPERLYITNDYIVTHNTFCALQAISNVGKRVVAVIKPMYIDKWVDDFNKTFEGFFEDVMVVKGSKDLRALLDLSTNDDLDTKAIIISSATLRNYITAYEKVGDELLELGWACLPQDLFTHLRAGVRLIDECHQDFHFYFKLDTYTHVPLSISLSATLITNDQQISRLHRTMFPLDQRLAKMALVRYIDTLAVHYTHKKPALVRTNEYGSSTYSHTAYEKSIIKHPDMLKNYLALIKYLLEVSYFRDKLPADRAIIFAASIEMCTIITTYLKTQYATTDVRRYVEDDPYENMLDADIRVTTIGSGGTAHDVADLAVGIMMTHIQSVQANVQALGRLRQRKEGKMEFYYAVADDLEKPLAYHFAKRELFGERAKTFREIYSGYVI